MRLPNVLKEIAPVLPSQGVELVTDCAGYTSRHAGGKQERTAAGMPVERGA
jgi:hypothetical protein